MKGGIYFKNLNGFRFIAAAMVMVCHLELFKSRAGQPNYWKFPLVFESGSAGVDFFFVLSGFLITSLLLAEKSRFNTIDLKKFYMRRILRIWPLYFLIVFFSFLIVPFLEAFHIDGYSDKLWENYWPKFLFSLFLMPNVALAFFKEIPYSAPLWSVGVEEQFYIFWPLLILLFSRHLKVIITFIALFIALKVVVYFIGRADILAANHFVNLKNFIVATRMECMGIGGFGAYLFYRKAGFINLLTSNKTALAAIIAVPSALFLVPYMFEFHHVVLSVLFLIIIMNGATNTKTFIRLEGKTSYNLGTISYGIYLWHSFAIGISVWMMERFNLWGTVSGNIFYYTSSTVLTLIISYVSYYYFEKRFLNIKQRFTLIVSGNEARTSGRPEQKQLQAEPVLFKDRLTTGVLDGKPDKP